MDADLEARLRCMDVRIAGYRLEQLMARDAGDTTADQHAGDQADDLVAQRRDLTRRAPV